MALPNREAYGQPILGFTAHELVVRQHVVKGVFESELAERSLTIATTSAPSSPLGLPVETTDDELIMFHSAFPRSDFARCQTTTPHAQAVAARSASIQEIIRLSHLDSPKSITLIGPSPSQAQKFRTEFPNARICVYQPQDSARDISRWRQKEVLEVELFWEMWSVQTAVHSDLVVSLFSAGCIHPSDFALACVEAQARKAFVLHHWSPQAFVHEHHDPVFKCTFRRSGDIEVSFPDAPSYHDSAECALAWLSGDIRAARHSLMIDVIVNFSSLKLFAITIAPGADEGSRTNMLSLMSEFRVLPAIEQYPEQVISEKLWEAVADYAARQRADLLTVLVVRNRVTSLKHRVSIGSTVIQNAVYCSDDVADQLALLVVKFIQLRAEIAERQQRLSERGRDLRAMPAHLQMAANLNQSTRGALCAVEIIARASINLNPLAVAASYVLRRELQPVAYSSAIPAGDQPTITERLTRATEHLHSEMAKINLKLSDRLPPVRSHTGDYQYRALSFAGRVIAPAANQCFWKTILFLLRFLPREVRFSIAANAMKLLQATILGYSLVPLAAVRRFLSALTVRVPVGFLLVDELLEHLFRLLGYERAYNPVRAFFPPSDRSAPPLSTLGSDHDSDDSSSDSESSDSSDSSSSGPSDAHSSSSSSSSSEQDGLEPQPEQVLETSSHHEHEMEPKLVAESTEETAPGPSLSPAPQEALQPTEDPETEGDGQIHQETLPMPPSEPIPEGLAEHLLTGPIHLNRPCNVPSPDDDNEFDKACPVPVFKDVAFNRLPKLNHEAPKIPPRFTCGPNTLRKSIIAALARPPGASLARHALEQLGKNTRAIQNGRDSKPSTGTEMQQFSGNVKAVLSKPLEKPSKLSLIVNGLPAAAKSSVLRSLISPEDVIICSTREHRDKWQADLKTWGCQAKVLLQHALIKETIKVKYRVMWIDEVFLLEIKHALFLAQFAFHTVGLGDLSQIAAFHTRKGKSKAVEHYPLSDAFASVWIECPFSLGLPVDVLIVGKKMGFCPSNARTANKTRAITFLDECPPVHQEDALNIVFNRDRRVDGRNITVHESQGQRPATAVVSMLPDEVHFLRTGHFWVAISRATVSVQLFLCASALIDFNEIVNSAVQGFYRRRSEPEAVVTDGSLAHILLDEKLHKASVAQVIAEKGLSTDALAYLNVEVPDEEVPEGEIIASSFDLTKEEINDALAEVNDNVLGVVYKDVVADTELTMPKDLTQPLSVLLDLQAGVKDATSTLNKAGVYFTTDDTKTEFFTIATRYLSQPGPTTADPLEMSETLFDAWMLAYVDPRKVQRSSLPGAAFIAAWYKSRTASLFNPGDYAFAEDSSTTVFHSFLKAHAKAKNDPGFGTKIEKGQTIAAGDQSYNIRHTAYCRELQEVLPQILYDDVVLDVGMSDEEFQAKCVEQDAYSAENTAADLSSQDSTHFEHHVIFCVKMLCTFTSITAEAALEYYTMRSHFTVKAKSFCAHQSIKYAVSWNLPSGDPYTLIFNCLHESASIAYIFRIRPETRRFVAFKGDDSYTKMMWILSDECEKRRRLVGVILKLEHCMPPFFAGRYILPDNSVHHDPVKHAAKYSVKRFDPTKVLEYLMAYRTLFPAVTQKQAHLITLYGQAHHPSMSYQSIVVLSHFARSLRYAPCFLRFQDFRGLSAQLVNPASNCARTVLGSLHLPKPPLDPTGPQLRRFLLDHHIPFLYYPSCSNHFLFTAAQRNPNMPVFSDRHCVAYLSETRYSRVQYL